LPLATWHAAVMPALRSPTHVDIYKRYTYFQGMCTPWYYIEVLIELRLQVLTAFCGESALRFRKPAKGARKNLATKLSDFSAQVFHFSSAGSA